MMAGSYMKAPVPRARPRSRAVLTRLAAVAFFLSLALYKPLVRYWIDPLNRRRQIVVSIVPRRRAFIPVLRLILAVALFAAVILGVPALMPTQALRLVSLVLVAVPVAVVALSLVTTVAVFALPYEGKIARSGPAVSGTQLTAGLAASTAGGGMHAVRAYLAAHHAGQRLTVRARDERARAVYEALGLEVVAPGRGRMTGVITFPSRPFRSGCARLQPEAPSEGAGPDTAPRVDRTC